MWYDLPFLVDAAGQSELRLTLGEPYGMPLDPEPQEPQRPLRIYSLVNCLYSAYHVGVTNVGIVSDVRRNNHVNVTCPKKGRYRRSLCRDWAARASDSRVTTHGVG
jgi:hypothetical protein